MVHFGSVLKYSNWFPAQLQFSTIAALNPSSAHLLGDQARRPVTARRA
jgi:cysteine sulfinate desulfinase/cysteine desulfurase-like protein